MPNTYHNDLHCLNPHCRGCLPDDSGAYCDDHCRTMAESDNPKPSNEHNDHSQLCEHHLIEHTNRYGYTYDVTECDPRDCEKCKR